MSVRNRRIPQQRARRTTAGVCGGDAQRCHTSGRGDVHDDGRRGARGRGRAVLGERLAAGRARRPRGRPVPAVHHAPRLRLRAARRRAQRPTRARLRGGHAPGRRRVRRRRARSSGWPVSPVATASSEPPPRTSAGRSCAALRRRSAGRRAWVSSAVRRDWPSGRRRCSRAPASPRSSMSTTATTRTGRPAGGAP